MDSSNQNLREQDEDLRNKLLEEDERRERQEMEERDLKVEEEGLQREKDEYDREDTLEKIRTPEPFNTRQISYDVAQQHRGFTMRRIYQIWEFLADVLVEPCFRSYIQWTGNGLEFQIINLAVIFTEYDHIRRNRVQMTQMSVWSFVETVFAEVKKGVDSAKTVIVRDQLDKCTSKAFQDFDLQFKEEGSMVKHGDEYAYYEQMEIQGEIQGRLIWQFLADILTGSTFRPYIYWTGNGLEFKIENPVVVFTEIYKIRCGEKPSTMLNPYERWRGSLLNQGEVDWYLRRMRRHTTRKPNIIQNYGRYYFDDHVQICDRLGWTKDRLLSYIKEAASTD